MFGREKEPEELKHIWSVWTSDGEDVPVTHSAYGIELTSVLIKQRRKCYRCGFVDIFPQVLGWCNPRCIRVYQTGDEKSNITR